MIDLCFAPSILALSNYKSFLNSCKRSHKELRTFEPSAQRMKTLHFNTNINCGGCIAAVTPYLNAEKRIEKWSVDIQQTHKPLTVVTDLEAQQVIAIVTKAGFQISQ